jgi:O-antigen/teichoic acid export membrane protein
MSTPAVMEPLSEVAATEPKPAASRPNTVARTAHQGLLALSDQAIVSGTNFATTLLVGRYAASEELGSYALGFSLLLLAVAVQQALVCTPYTVFAAQRSGSGRRELAGSALIHALGLMLVASSVALIVALLLRVAGQSSLAGVIFALTITLPATMLREFLRRFEFARLRMDRGLWLDLAVAVVQLALLSLLVRLDSISAVTALLTFAVAAAAICGLWLLLARSDFVFRSEAVGTDLARHWAFGRWGLAAGIVSHANNYSLPWLILAFAGREATGLFAACQTLVDLSNPVMLGLSNIIAPRAAHAMHSEGATALRRVVGWSTALVAALMIPFAATLIVSGVPIAAELFGKQQLASQHTLLALLAVAGVVVTLSMPASEGLAAAHHPRLNFLAGLIGLALLWPLAILLLPIAGLPGAALALLIGYAAGTLVRVVAFWLTTKRQEARP